jgi:hypothetical protein
VLTVFLSDIHSNLPALEATVADAKALQKDFAEEAKMRFLE